MSKVAHKRGNKNSKKKGGKSSGDLHLSVHSQINLSLDGINVRRVDLAWLPSNFDTILRFAPSYQRYRI